MFYNHEYLCVIIRMYGFIKSVIFATLFLIYPYSNASLELYTSSRRMPRLKNVCANYSVVRYGTMYFRNRWIQTQITINAVSDAF